MWITLTRRAESKEARLAFARQPLLGKTLATVHLMKARALSNVLWAMGKLGMDLEQEAMGPYLAEAVEERVRHAPGGAGGRPGGRAPCGAAVVRSGELQVRVETAEAAAGAHPARVQGVGATCPGRGA